MDGKKVETNSLGNQTLHVIGLSQHVKDYESMFLAENALPEDIVTMMVGDYDRFLVERRKLMAATIEKYYKGL